MKQLSRLMLYVMNATSQLVQPENPILKKKVLKSPMQLRISLQRSNYNMENKAY